MPSMDRSSAGVRVLRTRELPVMKVARSQLLDLTAVPDVYHVSYYRHRDVIVISLMSPLTLEITPIVFIAPKPSVHHGAIDPVSVKNLKC